MADPVLSKGEVARAQVGPNGLTGSASGDIDALAVSHEALREQNTALGVRVQEAWEARWRAEEAAEELAARLEAMTAVARRYRNGWRPIACVDGPIWCHPDDPNDPDPRLHDALTDAEAAVLDALEAGDAD